MAKNYNSIFFFKIRKYKPGRDTCFKLPILAKYRLKCFYGLHISERFFDENNHNVLTKFIIQEHKLHGIKFYQIRI